MKATRIVLLILAVCFSIAAQDRSRLKDIKAIYVDQLGSEEGSNLVREKIKIRLLKSKRFTLSEDPDKADAVLTGAAAVPRRWNGVAGTPVVALRLVDPQTKTTLWIYEYKPPTFSTKRAEVAASEGAINRLEKDAKTEDPRP